MKRGLGIAAIWLVMWIITWPAIFADMQSIGGDGEVARQIAREDYRRDLGSSMLLGALPPFWLITPFVTGFYEHGWKFR